MEEQRRQCEFNKADGLTIDRVAANMRAAGILMVIYGAGFILMGLATEGGAAFGLLLLGGLFFVIGGCTLKLGSTFALVTEPEDLGRLWTALVKLHRFYWLQKWLMLLGIVVFAGVFFGTFILIYILPKLQYYFTR
jgi:hypothetical protein